MRMLARALVASLIAILAAAPIPRAAAQRPAALDLDKRMYCVFHADLVPEGV